jgi:hypothetical protein
VAIETPDAPILSKAGTALTRENLGKQPPKSPDGQKTLW